MTKVAELTCSFHGGSECMGLGCLSLWQHPDESVTIGRSVYRGVFCTDSALYAWLAKHGQVIEGARPGDLKARRPGSRQHPEQRPTVATRRPRRSLDPRRSP